MQQHRPDTTVGPLPSAAAQPDGRWLVVNGDGLLFRIPVDGGELEQIPLGDIPPINNDHVIGPDGSSVYVSADDRHIYAVPFATDQPAGVQRLALRVPAGPVQQSCTL